MRKQDAGSPDDWLDVHGGALYNYAIFHLRDEDLAEEAVQETLLAALQARDRFSDGSSVRTWLISILKHKIMDMFRRSSREVVLDSIDIQDASDESEDEDVFNRSGRWQDKPSDWGNPEQTLARTEFMTILQHCVEALPPRLARLFMLREVMEEDTDSICDELSITSANLWTMLYRARMGLRRCLEDHHVGTMA